MRCGRATWRVFYQSSVFFPYFVSWVIVGYFGFAFLNGDSGLLNKWMTQAGLDTVSWYSAPKYWPYILTAAHIWKSAGYWSIIYLAGMMGINTEYYEAAQIDGASRWQQIKGITLPLLMPIILINILLSIGRIFYADFGLFYYVTRDSSMLYKTTDVIDTFVFRGLRSLGDFGMAAAAGLYQSIVGFVLILSPIGSSSASTPRRAFSRLGDLMGILQRTSSTTIAAKASSPRRPSTSF